MIDLTPSRLRLLLEEATRQRAEDRLMHLTLTNAAHHGGDAAKRLHAQLSEQAGLVQRRDPFAALLARARASAAARKSVPRP